ncbi:PilZ domain-containing protein [Candidatus Omnitrophota bacterium]
MKIQCLLDTNAIIKYYVDMPGSDMVRYLFDKSPTAVINITSVQIVEIISFLYTLRTLRVLRTDDDREQLKRTFLNDIHSGKIVPYEFTNEHSIDFPTYNTIALSKKARNHVNNTDTIFLLVGREMHYLTNANSFVFTSNIHVKTIAEAMKLNVLNPELMARRDLPLSLDQRRETRLKTRLQALCSDIDSARILLRTKALDVSQHGLCLTKGRRVVVGKTLSIKLSTPEKPPRIEETSGEVVWASRSKIGIRTLQPIKLLNIT